MTKDTAIKWETYGVNFNGNSDISTTKAMQNGLISSVWFVTFDQYKMICRQYCVTV